MIPVVAAIIRNADDKILIARRNLHKSQGGLWEFPGGKVESHESFEDALVREIREELMMDIRVDDFFDEVIHEYDDKTIDLKAYFCTLLDDDYEVLEHESIAWVDINDLNVYDYAPADRILVDKLLNSIDIE